MKHNTASLSVWEWRVSSPHVVCLDELAIFDIVHEFAWDTCQTMSHAFPQIEPVFRPGRQQTRVCLLLRRLLCNSQMCEHIIKWVLLKARWLRHHLMCASEKPVPLQVLNRSDEVQRLHNAGMGQLPAFFYHGLKMHFFDTSSMLAQALCGY